MFKHAKNQTVQSRRNTKNFGTIYEIGNYSVRIYSRNGHRYIKDHCYNGANSQPSTLCKHKIKAIVQEYLIQNKLKLVPVEDDKET